MGNFKEAESGAGSMFGDKAVNNGLPPAYSEDERIGAVDNRESRFGKCN